MNFILSAAIVFLCAVGGVLTVRDLKAGRARLWMGSQPIEVTRIKDPMLFWVAICGWIGLLCGLITLAIITTVSA